MSKDSIRLQNRIETCKNEVDLALRRLKVDQKDLSFWKNELLAAQAEAHGYCQKELNLTSCPTCGD